jgi:hypothetical protein
MSIGEERKSVDVTGLTGPGRRQRRHRNALPRKPHLGAVQKHG